MKLQGLQLGMRVHCGYNTVHLVAAMKMIFTPSIPTLGICCSEELNFCSLHPTQMQLPAASSPGKWDHLNDRFLWALSYCSAKGRIIHTHLSSHLLGIKPPELNSGPARGDANPPGYNGFLAQVNLTNYFHKVSEARISVPTFVADLASGPEKGQAGYKETKLLDMSVQTTPTSLQTSMVPNMTCNPSKKLSPMMMTVAPPVVHPSLGLMALIHGVAAFQHT